MKKEFRFLVFLLVSLPVLAAAGPSYKSILKKWTRHAHVYVWDNLEARLIWHATYFSDDFRSSYLGRMDRLYEWSPSELKKGEIEEGADQRRYDTFFVSVYSGSSQWPEIGKDDGKWKIVLETDGREPVSPSTFERLPVTEVERKFYPYLDKWSRAYLLKFPKTIHPGESFKIRMTGVPARSELVWK